MLSTAPMADPKKPKSGGGCLGKLAILFLLAIGGGFGLALFQVARPQDLSDIGGTGPAAPGTSSRDITVVLQNAVKRRIPVTLTESELNRWLATHVQAKQAGALASNVALEGVRVRLEEGRAEWILERSVMGRPFTVSMYLQVRQSEGMHGVRTEILRHGGPYHEALPHPNVGGRFGSLLVPQGFLLLVMPSFGKLAAVLAPEGDLVQEMARIRIEDGRLILDPRDPAESSMGLPQSF